MAGTGGKVQMDTRRGEDRLIVSRDDEQLILQLFDITDSHDLLTTPTEPHPLKSLESVPPYIRLENLLEPLFITSDPTNNELSLAPPTQLMIPNQPHSNTTRSDDSDTDVLTYVAKQESKRQKIEKEEDKNNDIRIINETPEPSDTGITECKEEEEMVIADDILEDWDEDEDDDDVIIIA